jgi:hypothetical protein
MAFNRISRHLAKMNGHVEPDLTGICAKPEPISLEQAAAACMAELQHIGKKPMTPDELAAELRRLRIID